MRLRDGAPTTTGRHNLNNSKNNFERAQVDNFTFPALPNVGEIKRIVIGHDSSGMGSDWHLNKVRRHATRVCFCAARDDVSVLLWSAIMRARCNPWLPCAVSVACV